MRKFLVIIVALAALASARAEAVELKVVSGQLLGATGVNVDGKLYDVEFKDGTCAALFDGCNFVSDFTFKTAGEAATASQALLNQVLLDGTLGAFDSNPEDTNGCSRSDLCQIMTPYAGNGFLFSALLANNTDPAGVDAIQNLAGIAVSIDWTDKAERTLALWTRTAVIPLPAAGWFLLSALGGLIGIGRFRKTRARA